MVAQNLILPKSVTLANLQGQKLRSRYVYCAEIYNKMGDRKAHIQLLVDTNNWDEVITVLD